MSRCSGDYESNTHRHRQTFHAFTHSHILTLPLTFTSTTSCPHYNNYTVYTTTTTTIATTIVPPPLLLITFPPSFVPLTITPLHRDPSPLPPPYTIHSTLPSPTLTSTTINHHSLLPPLSLTTIHLYKHNPSRLPSFSTLYHFPQKLENKIIAENCFL